MAFQVRLDIGDNFVMDESSSELLRIIRVAKDGVSVTANGDCKPRLVTYKDLIASYKKRNFRHWPGGLDGLEERKAEMLQVAFSAWPAAYRREAYRRQAYLVAFEGLLPSCRTRRDAFERAREEVFTAYQQDWEIEEAQATLQEYASKSHRKGETFDGPIIYPRKIKQPAWTTIAEWHKDWFNANKDVGALVPMWHKKGSRKPFFKVVDRQGRTTYTFAREAIDDVYMTLKRATKAAAYGYYEDLLATSELPASELMSDRAFRAYIDKIYTPMEQCVARKGRRRAYLDHGIFIPQTLPDMPLDEVEIDHCLVDVILVNKNGRIAGRPWITVLLDRATRCIIGLHVTFQPPSYHSVRIALAHSMYPKDLSAFPRIKRTWDCFGVPLYLISDQGKEFKSRSYKATCSALGIIPVLLPGRSPWLKGALERIFGHLGVAVFDLMEGATKFNDVDAYRSAKSARVDKDEFTERLIRWIVDRYHHRPHPKLEERYGKGTTPSMAWQVLTSKFGIRLARDPEQVHLITGEVFKCRIKSDGITIGSQRYIDKPVLQRLRHDHGSKKVWTVHRDDTDWGYVRVLDDTGSTPRWLTIPNFDAELMTGVSKAQFQIILQEAREMTPEESQISVAGLIRAKKRLEVESVKLHDGKYKKNSLHRYLLRWAKYGDLGKLVTPVPGFEHQVIANDQEPFLEEHIQRDPDTDGNLNKRSIDVSNGASGSGQEGIDDLDELIASRAQAWASRG